MKKNWIYSLAETNKELLLVFTIIAFAGAINFLVVGQRLALTFYNLPTLFAAYYLGRTRAVQTALGSILFVCWLNIVNPVVFASNQTIERHLLIQWSDITIWAGFLLISAYATGTLYERKMQRMQELREAYNGVLQILSQFIAKDKFTENHSYRVSVYATQIARHVGLAEDRIEDVRAAALLHDIGKLDVGRNLLYKAARLNEEEIAEMKLHVEKGVEILSPLGGPLRRVLPIILAHHDKFDGTGYHPSHGEEIPIEARIISVADVYDSLISDRPYRKAMSPFEARDIITRGAGTDFDPRVVAAFESAFGSQRMELSEVMV